MSLEIVETGTYRKEFGRGHLYYLDNVRVPGVTTLVNQGWPKNLSKWAAERVADRAITDARKISRMSITQKLKYLTDAPYESTNQAAMRGTQVHALAEKLVNGETVTVPADVVGWVSAYQQFLQEWEPKVLYAERPVYNRSSKPQYGGTFDLLADMSDGRRYLLDIKTTMRGKGIWGDHAFQGAAYRYAEFILGENGEEIPMPEVDEFAVVWLQPGEKPGQPGEYQLLPLEATKAVYRQFLSIAAVAQAQEDVKSYVGSPIFPPVVLNGNGVS